MTIRILKSRDEEALSSFGNPYDSLTFSPLLLRSGFSYELKRVGKT